MVEIIDAKEHHVSDIIDLNVIIQRLHSEQFPGIFKYPVEESELKSEFNNLINKEHHHVFVAIKNMEVVGYIFAQYSKRADSPLIFAGDKLYVHHICVSENFRKMGIGSMLFARIEELANKYNVNEIGLDVWNFNKHAHSFFKAYGFETYNEKMWLRT